MRTRVSKLSDAIGRVDAIRIDCPKCDRFTQCHVERLVYEFGPSETVSGWAAKITADCPRRLNRSLADPCAARISDLPTTSWTQPGTGLLSGD